MISTENTTQAPAPRAVMAHDRIKDFGAGYFNPLIGRNASETCGRISDVMEVFHTLIKKNAIDCEEVSPGLSLIIQTVWTAAQYEHNAGTEQQ